MLQRSLQRDAYSPAVLQRFIRRLPGQHRQLLGPHPRHALRQRPKQRLHCLV